MPLKGLIQGAILTPPRVVVYGAQGVGKTTLLASSRRPVLLPTERGADVVGCDRLSDLPGHQGALITSFRSFMSHLKSVATEDHDYQTVGVDSADWLERLIFADVSAENGVTSIEQIGYGKGYAFARDKWDKVLSLLDACVGRGMAVVVTAHATIRRFDAPDSEPYDRYGLKLHEGKGEGKANAAALIYEWADVVGFMADEVKIQRTEVGMKQEVRRGWSSGKRVLHTTGRPAFVAKNRYGIKDPIPMPADGSGWANLESAIMLRSAKSSARDILRTEQSREEDSRTEDRGQSAESAERAE